MREVFLPSTFFLVIRPTSISKEIMLDYKLPYHVIQEDEDEDIYLPKISFNSLEEAREFIKFAPHPKLKIVKTKDLKNYYLGFEKRKYQL